MSADATITNFQRELYTLVQDTVRLGSTFLLEPYAQEQRKVRRSRVRKDIHVVVRILRPKPVLVWASGARSELGPR